MTALSAGPQLLPAFADPVFDSQAVFRGVMTAMAYPGRVVTLDRAITAPAPLNAATTAICLTLADFETPLWLDDSAATDAVRDYLRFHCGAPLVADPATARFALIANATAMLRLDAFHRGEDQYPDRSATLLVQLPALSDGPETRWTGPGIDGATACRLTGLPARLWADWELNRELYPRGVDVIFASGSAIVGLPRATRVEV